MKNNTYIILLFILLTQSCNIEDDSIPQENFTTAIPEELLTTSIHQIAYNHSAIGGRSCSILMQHFLENDASIQPYRNYSLDHPIFNNMWSSGYYSGSLITLQELENLSRDQNNEDLLSMSLILKAHEYSTLTFYFGDIPLTEALQDESFQTPVYDTQESVINNLIIMLDKAIQLIGDKSSNDSLSENDILYNGDLSLWKKFAIGLKARILFNARNQNLANDQEILDLIEASFSNRSEQAQYTFNKGISSPQYLFAVERPSTLRSGDYIVELLQSTDDPRIKNISFDEGFYWTYFDSNDFITNWFEEKATIPLASYTELLFMQAELLHHQNDSQGNISSNLRQAIESSFTDNQVELDEQFLSDISDLSSLDQDQRLERIIEQAYIAFYGNNGQQVWNNYRRTGYPSIQSTADPMFTPDYNPSASIPSRFMYPSNELEYNATNTQAAMDRQDGGLLDAPMWVFN